MGLDRGQTLLFPERLEDYVAAENPVRFLDAFVGSLDLHALEFGMVCCEETGKLAFAGHPPAGGRQKRGDFWRTVTRGSLAMGGGARQPRADFLYPFGVIQFARLREWVKGLTKVRVEWSLTTLAYNLKRVLNLVSFEKLMAAVG